MAGHTTSLSGCAARAPRHAPPYATGLCANAQRMTVWHMCRKMACRTWVAPDTRWPDVEPINGWAVLVARGDAFYVVAVEVLESDTHQAVCLIVHTF